MNIHQLKLLAGCVRDLLLQSQHSIGHNQSLDLIAALPGLRNWPEVLAFPDRVAACKLDNGSATRLGFKLKRTFGLDYSPQEMLEALMPVGIIKTNQTPQMWPTGPAPGVYITNSQDAINALLKEYEEATDGALVYAERAGNHWEGSIDLGEFGLWSKGLDRIPSGTLIVVGPLMLDQSSWTSSSEHIEMACLIAQGAHLRVAVLLDTPAPEAMFEDVHLMVNSVKPDGDDCEKALLGFVSNDGQLLCRQPFVALRPRPATLPGLAKSDAIPVSVRSHLENALIGRTAGLLLFGSSELPKDEGFKLVTASLAMTEHAGPAARIMPRHRSTPAKDWMVPQAIQQLPFLPSIESAYEQGYRRMIIESRTTSSKVLTEYCNDVLFISGTYGCDIEQVYINTIGVDQLSDNYDLFSQVISILAVKYLAGKNCLLPVSDLYLCSQDHNVKPSKFDEIMQLLEDRRTVRWQDEMELLFAGGLVTRAAVKKAFDRNPSVVEFLDKWSSKRQVHGSAA